MNDFVAVPAVERLVALVDLHAPSSSGDEVVDACADVIDHAHVLGGDLAVDGTGEAILPVGLEHPGNLPDDRKPARKIDQAVALIHETDVTEESVDGGVHARLHVPGELECVLGKRHVGIVVEHPDVDGF